MLGLCTVEVNELGPAHTYVLLAPEVRFKVLPEQTGVLLPGFGVGNGLTVIKPVFTFALAHPPTKQLA